MGRGAGDTNTALSVRARNEDIRGLLASRQPQRSSNRHGRYRHDPDFQELPEREDDVFEPSRAAARLGLVTEGIEPCDSSWHGAPAWLVDTRHASGAVIPASARRGQQFVSKTDPLSGIAHSFISGLNNAVEKGFTRAVTIGAPEEWLIWGRERRWVRPVRTEDMAEVDPSWLVAADPIAHIERLLPPGRWRSIDGGKRLGFVLATGESAAAITAREVSIEDKHLR